MEEQLIPFLLEYRALALFVGVLFFGEGAPLAGAALAVEGYWSLWTVFWICYVAWLTLDTIWFYIGRHISTLSASWPRLKVLHSQGLRYLQRIHIDDARYQALYLISFKFFYGVRIVSVVALGAYRMPWLRFMAFNAIGTAVFVGVLVWTGAFVWQELSSALSTFQAVGVALTAIVMLSLLLRFGFPLLKERIARKRNSS